MPLKISIITPSYNQASYIEQAIQSVINQGYPCVEYIIIDAKSTDGTMEIIRNYGEKYPEIIKWFSEKDNGQIGAINRGFNMATGDIVAFLNSDDYYQDGCFDCVNRYFENQPEKNWLVGNCGIVPAKLQWTFTFKNFWPIDKVKSINYIFNFINQPAVFLRRKFIQMIGPLNEEYKLTFDYEYWLRCLKLELPGRVKQELAIFRVHKNAKSTMCYREQFHESYALAKKYSNSKPILLIHRLFIFIVEIIYGKAKGG
jgi:glycosyltransferase involved in cell wall biosynthesis